ncbi:MAG: hypothetical protein AABX01_05255 [Candidatus Micrarchaeota archaeon]
MERMTLLTVLLGLMVAVTAMQTLQLNGLNSGFAQLAGIKSAGAQITAGNAITTGSALSAIPAAGAADAEYEKMMDEMHPGWRQQQGVAAAPAGVAAPVQAPASGALAQIGNLPNMVGGC